MGGQGTGAAGGLADEQDSEGEPMPPDEGLDEPVGTSGGPSGDAGEDESGDAADSGSADDDSGDGDDASDDGASGDDGDDDGAGDDSGAAQCPAEVFELLWAEDASIEAPMVYGVASSAVGDPSVALSDIVGLGRVTFEVEIPCAGEYQVYGLVWDLNPGAWADPDADSFNVGLGGPDELIWRYGCQTSGLEHALSWQSLEQLDGQPCDVTSISVEFPEPGTYELSFRNREAGIGNAVAGIAALLIASDAGADPYAAYAPYED